MEFTLKLVADHEHVLAGVELGAIRSSVVPEPGAVLELQYAEGAREFEVVRPERYVFVGDGPGVALHLAGVVLAVDEVGSGGGVVKA